MLSYLIHANYQKHINMRQEVDVFNDSWRRFTRISTRQIKSIGKGRTKQRTKIQTNEDAQIDALLTKIMDNEASEPILKTCQEPRMAHISHK